MENLKKAGVDTRILEIAKMAWPHISEKQIGDHFFIDIDFYDLTMEYQKINQLEIEKIDENKNRANVCLFPVNENGINKIKIEAGSMGGLAHEISHLVFKCKKNEERMSGLLTEHIVKTCKTSGCNKLITNYFKIETLTKFDKLIGYLYLTDEDELIAKLAGFYIGAKLENKKLGEENKYVKGVKSLYAEMKTFEIDLMEIKKQGEKEMIVKYLNLRVPINSKIVKTIVKNIHDQGVNFEEKCKILGV